MKNNAEINDVTAKCQQSGTEIISTQENRDAQPRQSMQFHIFRNAAPIYAHRAHEVGSLVPRSRHERTVLSCTDVGAADTHDRWGLSACESGAHTVRSCGAGEAARQGRPGVLFSLLLLILMLLPGMARSASADDWTDPNNLPNTSGIYKLQVDVTADYWFRQRGTTLLDLNGHILTITDDPGIVVQQKATLNITDSKGGGSIIFNKGSLKVTLGELALSYCTIQGDVILEPTELSSADVSCIMNRSTIEGSIYMNEGSFVSSYPQYTNTMEMQNGSTIRCSADACVNLNDEEAVFELRGGSIRANGVKNAVQINAGTIRQSGGEITLENNHSTGTDGVMLGDSVTQSSGSYIMTGGSINGFTGIPGRESGYAVNLKHGGSFSMEGGTISGNGVGVLVGYSGSFAMSGGSITGNTIGASYFNVAGSIKLSGNPNITGNTNKNLSIGSKKISFSGPLDSSARIGISMETPGVFTDGLEGNGELSNFIADQSGFLFGLNAEKEAVLGQKRTVKFDLKDAEGNTITPPPDQIIPNGAVITKPEVSAPDGYMVNGWYLYNIMAAANKWDFDRPVDITTSSMTLYARLAAVEAAIGSEPYASVQDALDAAKGGDTVTLIRDAAPTAPLKLNKNVTLDLNGKTINRGLTSPTEDGYVIRVTLARNLIIKDSKGGGKITGGNNSGNGGGILVDDRGTLVLEGGAITGNNAEGKGGGVYIDNDKAVTNFVARGGEISGNTGGSAVSNLYLAAGKTVSIHQRPAEGTNIGVTLADGSGIFAESTGNYQGGILSPDDVKGFVSDNAALAVGINADGKGILGAPVTVSFDTAPVTPAPASLSIPTGGLVPKPEVTIPEGKAIAGWYKESTFQTKWNFNADTVNAALTLYAKITDAEPVAEIGNTKYDTVQDALDDAVSGDTVTLLKNVDLEGSLTLAAGKTVTLDLKGFTIDRGLTGAAAANDGYLISVSGSLTLSGDGTLTGASTTRGAVYVNPGGSFTLQSGTISGNTGSGVYVHRGSFTMEGGEISGNTSSGNLGPAVYCYLSTCTMTDGEISGNSGYSGAVYVSGFSGSGNATFTMTGGTIMNNHAANSGGAVFAERNGMFIMGGGSLTNNTSAGNGGAVFASDWSGTTQTAFTMKGGTISGNRAEQDGGAVYCNYEGDALIEGGTITDNSAGSKGGGIYDGGAQENLTGSVTVSGGTVTGNRIGSGNTTSIYENNIYLPDGKTLTVRGSLSAGTKLGIMMETPGVFGKTASGAISFAPADYFSSDNYNYGVGLNSAGEATLGNLVRFEANGGSGTMADQFVEFNSQKYYSFPNGFTREGYGFSSWNTAADGSGKSYAPTDLIKVTQSMTLYAQWQNVWQWVQSELNAGKTSITLPSDATAGEYDQALETKSGAAVTIDLNGYTLDRGNPDFYTDDGGGVVGINQGNVITANDSLTLTGTGIITGGNHLDDGGGIVVNTGNLTVGSGIIIRDNHSESSGGGIAFNGSGTLTLQDGAVIENNSANINGGGIAVQNASKLRVDAQAVIQDNTANNNGGGIWFKNENNQYSSMDIRGQILRNTAAVDHGGGIYAQTAGEIAVQTAVIAGNKADKGRGGGIYADKAGHFYIYGSEISGNSAYFGGGIFAASNVTKFSVSYGSLIKNNSALINGGGIDCGAKTMNLGKADGAIIVSPDSPALSPNAVTVISENQVSSSMSPKNPGGVFVSSETTFNMRSRIQISGNSNSNVFLRGNNGINIAENLDSDTLVGITMFSPGIFTSGLDGRGNNTNFFSDDPNYAVGLTDNKEATLTTSYYTVSFNVGSYGTAPEDQKIGPNGLVSEPEFTPTGNYAVEGWYRESGFTNRWNYASDNVTENMTLYAKVVEAEASLTYEGTTTLHLTVEDAIYNIPDEIMANGLSHGLVTLLKDIKPERSIRIDNKLCVFDLAGHIIDGSGENVGAGILEANGSNLVLMDSSADRSGKIIAGNGSSGIYFSGSKGKLSMEGGTIEYNHDCYRGAGVYLAGNQYFHMSGGRIINNSADEGGGVYFHVETNDRPSFRLRGNGQISGNTDDNGESNNVRLHSVMIIEVTGSLTGAENSIGITMEYNTGVFAKAGTIENSGGEYYNGGKLTPQDVSVFFSDNPSYLVGLNPAGEAFLGVPQTVHFVIDGVEQTEKASVAQGGLILNLPDFSIAEGHIFDSWYKEEACTTPWDFDSDAVNGETTLYARTQEAEASITADGKTTYYLTVQDGINAAQTGETVTVLKQHVIINTNLSVNKGKDLTLDLNGCTIDRGLSGSLAKDFGEVIHVYGKLTLDDSAGGGRITGGNNMAAGSGVIVAGGGTFIMKGGTISGNKNLMNDVKLGGGVLVQAGASFTMEGGEITQNEADFGGGVVLNFPSSVMNVKGSASISGNTGSRGFGPNVLLMFCQGTSCPAITVTGPLETGASIGVQKAEGAGVFAIAADDYNGGKLSEADMAYFHSDNSAYIVGLNPAYQGILGVPRRVDFILDKRGTAASDPDPLTVRLPEGAVITEPTVTVPDGYVLDGWYTDPGYQTKWDFTTGAVGSSDLTLYARVLEAVAAIGDAKYTTVQAAIDAAQTGETVKVLKQNVVIDAPLDIASGKDLTLDLNGCTIDRGLANANANSAGNVISVNGKLTLDDSKGGGLITGGNSTSRSVYTGGIFVNSGAVFTLNGGTISRNKTTQMGGGVFVQSGHFIMNGGMVELNSAEDSFGMKNGGGVYLDNSQFTMNGGTIQTNQAASGGGVYIKNSTFTMEDGYILLNKVSEYGAGVYLASGSFEMKGGEIGENKGESREGPDPKGGGVYVENGKFTLSGGIIHNNTATNIAVFGKGLGGGIYVNENGSFTISGGSVQNNIAGEKGGGVYFDGEYLTLTAGGGSVSGNTRSGSKDDNIYLTGGKAISISQKPGDVSLGITLATDTGIFTRSPIYTITDSDKAKFTSDNPDYTVGFNDSNQLILGYAVAFDTNGASGDAPDPAVGYPAASLHSDSPVKLPGQGSMVMTGYTLGGWNTLQTPTDENPGTAYAVGADLIPTENMTVYAQWSANSYTVKFDKNTTDPVTGTMADQPFTYDTAQKLTANAFARTGYDFSGWNTAADGSGSSYTDEQEVKNLTDVQDGKVTLYAQWTAASYSITLPAMGETGCTVTALLGGTSVTEAPYGSTVTLSVKLADGFKLYADTLRALYGTNQELDLDPEPVSDITADTDFTFTQPADNVTVEALLIREPEAKTGLAAGTTPQELVTAGASNLGEMQYALGDENGPTEAYSTAIPTAAAAGTYYVWYRASDAVMPVKIAVTVKPIWTVTFDPNTGTGDMLPQTFVEGAEQELTPHSFKKEGHGFEGWNTAADGNGKPYTDGQKISVSKDITLYAQWKANVHTVSFIANGGEGTMTAEDFDFGTTQTLKKNEFTRVGYRFTGWNTAADGSGTPYNDEASVTITDDLTLYARWQGESFSVSFDGNGGDGTMAGMTVVYGEAAQTLTKNIFTREHYSFGGWNTAADGSGTSYADEAPVSDLTANLKLYAQWTPDTYTVTFYPNGGSGSMKDQSFTYGVSQALTAHSFTYARHGFEGWNTEPNGDGQAYDDGQTISLSADLKLYAQWKTNVHTVTFLANGGEGTMHAEDYGYGTTQNLKENAFTREHYRFSGWNTEADGSGTSYMDQASVTIRSDLTLYAQWTPETYSVRFYPNEGAGSMTPQSFTYGVPQALKTHTFTREGYGFEGWNTKADGSGTAYNDGQTLSLSGDLTLYARWTANAHTVSFISNGGTGKMSAEVFPYGTTMNLTPNAFSREGHSFSRWTTEADGSGTPYNDEASVTITADLTLYAQWTPDTYTVSFDSNGGSGSMTDQPFTYGVAQQLTLHSFSYEGHGFYGWNTAANGSGTSHTDGQEITVSADMTLYAQWAANSHTVTFLPNGGEGTMTAEVYHYGTTKELKKNEFTREGHRFTGWNTAANGSGTAYADKASVTISQDLTLHAQWEINTYTITWMDGDGKIIKTEQAAYGTTPSYSGSTPTKTESAQYSYTFNNSWRPAIQAATKAQTYTAQFDRTVKEYEITWLDGDGLVLKTDSVAYGDTPVYSGKTPTRTATDEHNFSFNNSWSPALKPVTGARTYTAQFDYAVNEYGITWVDGNGQTLKTEDVAYGDTPVYSGNTPTKTADAQYTYTFNNSWTPEIEPVTTARTYTAQFDALTNEYAITWVDGNGQMLKTENVAYGTTPVYSGVTPTKTGDAQYSFTFNNNWSPDIVPVTGDASYTAQFDRTINEYDIIWVDGDGEPLYSEPVAYGTIPSYSGPTPTKAPEDGKNFSFNGDWSPDIQPVTKETTYTAVFDSALSEYTITWMDGNGQVLRKDPAAYGATPVYSGSVPTKTGDAQYSYTFNDRWEPSLEAVTKDQTYTAQFDRTVNKYEITWKDGDGSVLKKDPVAYGATPAYTGNTPTKTGDARYSYTFNERWSPNIVPVTGDASYTAQFDRTINEYDITWKDGDGKVLTTDSVAYGMTPSYSGPTPTKAPSDGHYYSFNGSWSPSVGPVTGEQTYTAQFDEAANAYDITWVDGDGKTLKTESAAYGTTPVYSGNTPTKTADAQYTYIFNGRWDPAIEAVTKAQTYTAQFDATTNEYDISWLDGDGITIRTDRLPYGETPVYSGSTPVKTPTDQNVFVFNGNWQPAISKVTGSVEYRAQFDSVESGSVTVKQTTISQAEADKQRPLLITLLLEDTSFSGSYGPNNFTNGASSTVLKDGETWTVSLPLGTRFTVGQAVYDEFRTNIFHNGTEVTGPVSFEYENHMHSGTDGVITTEAASAEFKNTRIYAVTWVDGDGNTLQTEWLDYGETPSYRGAAPTKADDAQYTYAFNGTWAPAIGAVTKDQTYTAQFNTTTKKYTITWKDGNGQTLKTDSVAYGDTPAYIGDTPTKTADAQYTYTFNNSWSPDIEPVTGEQTYTALFDAEALTITYTVTWKNWDGTVLKTEQNVPQGTVPAYTGDTPVKDLSDGNTWTFTGWNPEPAALTGDAEYTAQFRQDDPDYVVESGEGQVINTADGQGAVFVVTRTVNDDQTYPRFLGIRVDDVDVDTINYEAEPGSVIITLKPHFVESLSEGPHVLTVIFTDGEKYIHFSVVKPEQPAVPMDMEVNGTNFTNTGAKGVPADVASTSFTVSILITDGDRVLSKAEGVVLDVFSGVPKFGGKAHFDRTVENLSGGTHHIVINGLPSTVTGAKPIEQQYSLSYDAWVDNNGAITVYLKWDDGKYSAPEVIKVYPLPEDEVGAYALRKDGTKEYLIFHTYDICMHYLGRDDLCRGFERCYHKVPPYHINWVK